jgi:hypothetical protein
MHFSTANSERMRIDSSGNLGIGTNSPSTDVEIEGSTGLRVGDGTGYAKIFGDSSQVRIGSGSDDICHLISNNTNRMSFTNGGKILLSSESTTSSHSIGGVEAKVQQIGNNATRSQFALGRFTANAAGPNFDFFKSRNATPGSNTIVNDGDTLGNINWYADDGTDYVSEAARIEGVIDGTPGENDTPGRLEFKTTADGSQSSTERLRITSDGHLLLGTTSAQGVGGYTFQKGATGFAVHQNNDATSGGFEFHVFRRSSTQIGSIAQNGTTGIQLNTSSDARLKEVTGSARGLDVINNLNPVAYNWKADNRADEGLIAQEVKEFMPNAVSQTEDGYYMMDYSKLVTPLIKAVQEQQEEIEELKKDSHSPKGLEDMDGYGDLIDTIETLRAEIAILKGE